MYGARFHENVHQRSEKECIFGSSAHCVQPWVSTELIQTRMCAFMHHGCSLPKLSVVHSCEKKTHIIFNNRFIFGMHVIMPYYAFSTVLELTMRTHILLCSSAFPSTLHYWLLCIWDTLFQSNPNSCQVSSYFWKKIVLIVTDSW
jgi:hypothetical protein